LGWEICQDGFCFDFRMGMGMWNGGVKVVAENVNERERWVATRSEEGLGWIHLAIVCTGHLGACMKRTPVHADCQHIAAFHWTSRLEEGLGWMHLAIVCTSHLGACMKRCPVHADWQHIAAFHWTSKVQRVRWYWNQHGHYKGGSWRLLQLATSTCSPA
jgi:hypothetical protein